MEDEKINIQYENNIYKFKILYLIRTNLPKSEYIYIITYLIKYMGLILFSISLNEWNNEQTKDIPNNEREKSNNNFENEESSSFFNVQHFFANLIITGHHFKVLSSFYEIICLIVFIFFIAYIFCFIYVIYLMKLKYHSKNQIDEVNRKLSKINNSSKLEKKAIKIFTYIFFAIAFFHQYIIEYFILGFLINILNSFNIYEQESFNNTVLKEYSIYINQYILNKTFNSYFIIVITLIVMTLSFLFFIAFMVLNSNKTLFINNGYPFYGNNKYLFIKIIIFNYNELYGLVNMYGSFIKTKIILIITIIDIIILLIDIFLSFFSFSFYPSKLGYMSIFIEFFCIFSNATEILIYLTKSNVNSTKFKLVKLIILLANSAIFTIFFMFKKNENSLKIFADNLFSKSFKVLNPDDIYFYIKIYLIYSNNKKENYIKIFRVIQNHTLACNKKDCPCKVLIPKFMSYSIFTNFSKIKNDDIQNEIENNKEERTEETIINQKKLSETNILQNKDLVNLFDSTNNVKENIGNNIKIQVNENETSRKPNLKKRKTELNKKNDNDEKNNKKYSIVTEANFLNETNLKSYDNNEIDDKNLSLNDDKRKLKDEQFRMIGEQEIINRIHFLYKRKDYQILETYIFIHLQYLIKIKQNYRLALYFVGKYLLCGIKFSFLSRYYLYEIKKYINNSIIRLQKIKLINDPYIIKYKQENISLKKLINYLLLYNMIKKLLKYSCEKIIFFYSFRSELHNSLSLQKYIKSKIYPVINAAEDIQLSISKLKFLIEKYNKEEKHPIESIELSYLISNFFKMVYGKISQDILENIYPILYFKEMHYEKLENEYHLFMMSNPLIIGLTKKDSFTINYFTNIFLNKLGYACSDLMGKDFHEKLFPGGQDLIKEHSLIMKQFLFNHKNVFCKSKTFLKSKEGYLVSIDFKCKIFPNFTNNFSLISNIIFNDEDSIDELSNPPNENFKKINNNDKDKMVNSYSFLLNYDFDFFGLTKNFYLEYDLNQNMFRELRINFCQFFCVDEAKLIEEMHNERSKILKKFSNYNNKLTLKEINDAYSIFKNISVEKTFKLRDEKIIDNYFYQTISIYDKIDKKKLIHKIPELISIIDEIGLDYDWYIRLQNFKERLINNSHFQNSKDTLVSNLVNDKHKNIKNDNRHSSIIEPNGFENNFMNLPEQYFEVVYSVKKLGSISYYIVNLYERFNNNLAQSQVSNPVEDIFNKMEGMDEGLFKKEKFKKSSLKKTMKLHRFLSTMTKNEDENEEKDIDPTTRKAKTKIFSPDFVKKKNSISINSFNPGKTITEIPTTEERSKRSESKKNVTEFDIKNNDSKKEEKEADKEDNNNIELREKSKNQKTIKIFDKNEYLKKMKLTKKDYAEDEENSPLITKDKFIEVLKKNNKVNKILIIIIFIIILAAMALTVSKFFISLNGFEISKNVLKTTIYLEMLKIDIFVQGILSIIYCINENENITDISNIHSEAKLKIKSTMDHVKGLQDQINIIINNKYCSEILKILEDKFEIYSINDDWTETKENVDFLEEIRSLSYKINNLSNSTNLCNITHSFYTSAGNAPYRYQIGELEKLNDIQKIVHYFLRNIYPTYRQRFDDLSEESTNTIERIWVHFQHTLFYLLIFIISIIVIFIIFYIIKYCFDCSFYQLLFLYYYNIEKEQLKFENQIFYLYKTINDFNYDSIDYFEYVKSNENLIFYNEETNKYYSNFIKNKNTNHFVKNIHHSLTKKKNYKDETPQDKGNQGNDKGKPLDRNSLGGSFLNGSMNGSSSLLFLNNSKKISLNNNIDNNSYLQNSNDKEEKENSKEESIDSLLNMSKKTLPKSLKLFLFFILLAMLIYFGVCILNIIGLFKENKIWKYSIYLSMNLLERVPKLMGMLIYACVNIIAGVDNTIIGSPFTTPQSKYLSYFEANSLYYSEDVMNKYFKNKYFGVLLRDNLRVNYNYNNYLFQETNDIFTNTKEWENALNEAGNFCINSALGEVLSFQEEYTIYDFASEINYYATNCKNDDTGINESGAQLEISYILEEITNKYIEYIARNNSNITLDQARKNFFGSSDIRRIVVDMQLSLILYFNTITFAINNDFINKNNKIINEQILYSGILAIINFIIILCLLLSIKKNEKYKKLFAYFSEIPKSNYNN